MREGFMRTLSNGANGMDCKDRPYPREGGEKKKFSIQSSQQWKTQQSLEPT
jgi:hypothetical protein